MIGYWYRNEFRIKAETEEERSALFTIFMATKRVHGDKDLADPSPFADCSLEAGAAESKP